MTSPAAVIGLTYAGTDIQESDLGIFLEIYRGLSEVPTVRGRDTTVPARAFTIPRNRVADSLTIELRGLVRGEGASEAAQRSDFRSKVDSLRTLFAPTRDPAALVATCEDGSVREILCRPLPTQVWSQQVPTLASVSIELAAYEDWHGSRVATPGTAALVLTTFAPTVT